MRDAWHVDAHGGPIPALLEPPKLVAASCRYPLLPLLADIVHVPACRMGLWTSYPPSEPDRGGGGDPAPNTGFPKHDWRKPGGPHDTLV